MIAKKKRRGVIESSQKGEHCSHPSEDLERGHPYQERDCDIALKRTLKER